VTMRKGNGESVRRHVSDLILLMENCLEPTFGSDVCSTSGSDIDHGRKLLPVRRAAKECANRNRLLFTH